MIPISKHALGIAAGVGGILFVGYCIYFDRKRHADPNFKTKLREKRKKNRQEKLAGTKVPDLRTQEAVQRFFITEIQAGEDLLQQGDIDGGVEHLGMAISVCNQPTQLMQLFQQTLPPQIFHVLAQRLPMIGVNVQKRHREQFGVDIGSTGGGASMPGFPPAMMMSEGLGPIELIQRPGPSLLSVEEDLE